MDAAVSISGLTFHYGARQALDAVDMDVGSGKLFALLGPNGSGKSTLFRILSTYMPPQVGNVSIAGHDVRRRPHAVRRAIGVVFQHPSLDKHLTVMENLRHQARLYGMGRASIERRAGELLDRFGIAERAKERVGRLSGGLQRRVELAKAMMHEPQVLILDEPSTGLDPNARSDLMASLCALRDDHGVLCLLTTHLMDEADQCDLVGVLDEGRLIAMDRPDNLKGQVGGDVLTIQTFDPVGLSERLRSEFKIDARVVDGTVRAEHGSLYELVPKLHAAFGDMISTISVGTPTLADAFFHLTGHRLWKGDRASARGAAEANHG